MYTKEVQIRYVECVAMATCKIYSCVHSAVASYQGKTNPVLLVQQTKHKLRVESGCARQH